MFKPGDLIVGISAANLRTNSVVGFNCLCKIIPTSCSALSVKVVKYLPGHVRFGKEPCLDTTYHISKPEMFKLYNKKECVRMNIKDVIKNLQEVVDSGRGHWTMHINEEEGSDNIIINTCGLKISDFEPKLTAEQLKVKELRATIEKAQREVAALESSF